MTGRRARPRRRLPRGCRLRDRRAPAIAPALEPRCSRRSSGRSRRSLDAAASARGALAIGPGLGRAREAGARAAAARGDRPARGRRRRRALRARAVRARRADGADAARGELARLLGEESSWVDAHRLEAVRARSSGSAASCLLKGADTLVGAPGQGVWVVGRGPPSLATAGTGDVLTGVIAAFLAKGMERRLPPPPARCAAARARAAPHQVGSLHRDVIARAPGGTSIHRSEITIDLGAVRRNIRTLLRELDGSELWAVVKADGYGHGAVDVAAAALGAGATRTLRRDGRRRRSSCAHEFPAAKIVVLGPTRAASVAHAREAGLELVVVDGEIPEGVPRPPQARHRHGALGPVRAPVADARRRRADDAPRDRRHRPRVRARADRALPRGDRAVLAAPDAARRQQRRRASLARVSLRRRALRDRALRPVAVRRRPGAPTASSRRCAGEPSSRRSKLLRAGESTGLRPPLRRRASRPGSASSRSATRTASGAT